MKFVCYTVTEADKHHDYACRHWPGVFEPFGRHPENSQGQKTIDEKMSDLVEKRKCGKVKFIARLVGENKNHPHDSQHGDDS